MIRLYVGVVFSVAAIAGPAIAQNGTTDALQAVIAANGPAALADRVCAAGEDGDELLRAAAAVNEMDAYGRLIVAVRDTCPGQGLDAVTRATRVAPGRAGEIFFALAAAEQPRSRAAAPVDEALVAIAAAVRDGLVGLDNDGSTSADVIRIAFVLGGRETAEEVAKLFGHEDDALQRVVAAAENLSDNSQSPGLRSVSLFERVDNMPINVVRPFDGSSGIIDVTSPGGGERPSPN